MVLAVARDPGPVLPSLILEQDATGGLTQGYTSLCPDGAISKCLSWVITVPIQARALS